MSEVNNTHDVTDEDREKIIRSVIDKIAGHVDGDYTHTGRPSEWLSELRRAYPAPPATLADELREWFDNYDHDSQSNRPWNDLDSLIDRVQALERNREEWRDSYHEVLQICGGHVAGIDHRDKHIKKVKAERDEAKKEVERLNSVAEDYSRRALNALIERDDARDEVERLTRERAVKESRTVALPDPADVPKYVPYDIYYGDHGRDHTVGIRTSGGWRCIGDDKGVRVTDQNIARLTCLVPDVRRVIDRVEGLDAMDAGSVILDHDADSWTRHDDALWYCFRGTSADCEALIDTYGPVTVIHEPEVVTDGDATD